MLVASVLLDLKLNQSFDYLVPEDWIASVKVGQLIEVPLRNQVKQGIILKLCQERPNYPLKPLLKILDNTPLISEELLKLAYWMSEYYCTPLSLILPGFLPRAVKTNKHKEQYWVARAKTRQEIAEALQNIRKTSAPQAEILDYMLKQEGKAFLTEVLENSRSSRSSLDILVKKGLLTLNKALVERSPFQGEVYFKTKPKQLNHEQQQAFDKIASSIFSNQYCTHLLHGITGSGKTEIYLQAIAKALELDKGAIMLVPEIALTSQTIEHFKSRFENNIAILHYRLSDGEKHDEWKRIQRGEAKIVIGARSAVFSPVANLGLIIVDEEHDSSYKQTDLMPAYHARDVAVMRGYLSKAAIILGSATPSMESYHNALVGKYALSTLTARAESRPLPKVTLVDMKIEYEKKKGMTIFSEALLEGIEKRLHQGEQTILFLNRRGYHTLMLCGSCGKSIKCTLCDVSMTYHKGQNALICHLCHSSLSPPPRTCPECHSEGLLKFRGVGTEQVETALYAIFPELRILRLDADTTKHKGSHQKLYRSFRTGKADLLIGTQMLAKGLHFPEVTLVGILNSDISLNIPDFRSGENTFQLLTQVAGRAGRGLADGEVIIQTCVPENSTIQHASRQDFESYFKEEYAIRKLLCYPPFAHLATLRFSGKDLSELQNKAEKCRQDMIRQLPEGYHVSVVDAPTHAKIKEIYRLQFVIKGPKLAPIQTAIRKILDFKSPCRKVKILVDINPV